jgi:hypothetical protein
MLRRKRKTKNEIAGFFRLNARKLAKSKRPVSQKTTHDQRLIPLFTGDHVSVVTRIIFSASSTIVKGWFAALPVCLQCLA